MGWPIQSSLAARVSVLVLFLSLVSGLGIGLAGTQRRAHDGQQALQRRSYDIARAIALQSRKAVYTRNETELHRILDSFQEVSDLLYIRILDAQNQLLAQRVHSESALVPRPPDGVRVRADAPVVRQLGSSAEPHSQIDLFLPILSLEGEPAAAFWRELEPGAQLPRLLGHVQLGVDGRSVRAEVWAFAFALGPAALLIVLGVGSLSWLGVGRLTRPVRELLATTGDIAEGNFDVEIQATSSDEVGRLATALGVMLDRLRGYRDQVEAQQRAFQAKVRDRTVELEQRTAEAEEYARRTEAATVAKSRFFANVSHEIRTPMNGVLGMAELLLESSLAERQTRFAKTIHRSARSLLSLIDDILDLSKAEAGKLELEDSVFELATVVEEVVELLAERAATKGLELACVVGQDVDRSFRGDPARLRQILINLVGNAVKFTEKGEVVVRACCSVAPPRGSDGEASVELLVTDTGIGIPSDAREDLFQSFTQVDGSIARRFGGTGLGLSICYQLVELMNGEISLESEEGRGSRFCVKLPLHAIADEKAPKRLPAATRVLLLTGQETQGAILAHRLGVWGAKIARHSSLETALEDLRQAASSAEPYTAVIYDTAASGVDGLDLPRAIHADEAIPVTRVVALMTVGQSPPENESAVLVDAWILKPVRGDELFRSLSDSRSPLAADPGAQSAQPLALDESRRSAPAGAPRILLAEDSEVNQDVALAMLEQVGCSVHCVQNGADAVEAVKSESFDLVLMDCQMPGMDGFEATRAIRAWTASDPSRATLPIVALTAHARPSDRRECMEAGMHDFLSKPYSLEELRATLERSGVCSNDGAGQLSGRRDESTPAGAATRNHETAALDPNVLSELQTSLPDTGADFVIRLIDTFLESSTQLVDVIRESARAKDWRALASASHKLKSSSAQLGAGRLSSLAKELEANARGGSGSGVEGLVARLDAEFEAALEALVARQFGASDDD